MALFEHGDLKIEVDEDGFMQEPDLWTEEVAGGAPAVRYSRAPWLRLLRSGGVGPHPDAIYRIAPRSSSEYSASCDTMNS